MDIDMETNPEFYAAELKARIQEVFSMALENKQHSQKDNQLDYDRKTAVVEYQIDERVYVKNNERIPKGMKKKMMNKWIDSVIIKAKKPPTSYLIEYTKRGKRIKKLVHANLLKKFKPKMGKGEEKKEGTTMKVEVEEEIMSTKKSKLSKKERIQT
jgi:hypothetical protein